MGYVRYEAASAFDSALETHAGEGPLAWFGVYDAPIPWPTPTASEATVHWQSTLDRFRFTALLARILDAIANGEVYQVNLTASLHARLDGEAIALFTKRLCSSCTLTNTPIVRVGVRVSFVCFSCPITPAKVDVPRRKAGANVANGADVLPEI